MDPLLASIIMFGGTFAPKGWAFCNGQQMSIAQNTALFSLLGTTYGGNGQSTFGLPDLRGRVPMHIGGSSGAGPGLNPHSLGEMAGQETVTLLVSEMPQHTHTVTSSSNPATTQDGDTRNPANAAFAKEAAGVTATYNSTATPDTAMKGPTVTLAQAGGGQPHNNMQPYTAVNFIIALQGVFPSRN